MYESGLWKKLSNGSHLCAARGGGYGSSDPHSPAAKRGSSTATSARFDVGFRLSLW